MGTDEGRPAGPAPSMRQFDYFAEGVKPVGFVGEGQEHDAAELRLAAYEKARQRAGRRVVLTTVFLLVALWFVAGYRDLASYALRSDATPLLLGDVAGLVPSVIPHNAYVGLEGITELRGMTQRLARGLTLWSTECHYFRLLGSRGVFLEVPVDGRQLGFATAVRVRGRAVDPKRERRYAKLLDTYHRLHPGAEQRADVRIIQVDLAPGQERGSLLLGLTALLAFAVLNSLSVAHYVRLRRQKPLGLALPTPTR